MHFSKKAAFAVLFAVIFMLPLGFAAAQTLDPARRAELEQELRNVEKQIAEQEAILKEQKNRSSSLERDIAILTANINRAKLNIRAKNILIEQLTKDIGTKTKKIGELTVRLDREKTALAQILRKTHQIDSYSMPEVILAQETISDFFEDVDSFDILKGAIKESSDTLRDNRVQTENQKKDLQKRKDAETDARVAIENDKREIEKNETEKRRLLNLSKTQEAAYSVILAERARRASEIRTTLFQLRDSAAIPFERALELANEASRKTGIRPAFLLAIITQESALGANVGSCVITNLQTGETKSVNSGKLFSNGIHPTRDLPLLQTILKGLGRDPLVTKVSCPLSVGYGGAMGPAQFIPSTWKLFASRIAQSVGKTIADPWNPQDAFMASALYLTDLGAISGSYTGERNAACRYYSGRACSGTVNTTYGNQVMVKAQKIQDNINILQGI